MILEQNGKMVLGQNDTRENMVLGQNGIGTKLHI